MLRLIRWFFRPFGVLFEGRQGLRFDTTLLMDGTVVLLKCPSCHFEGGFTDFHPVKGLGRQCKDCGCVWRVPCLLETKRRRQ